MLVQYITKYFINLISILTLLTVIWFAYDYHLDRQQAEKERLQLEARYKALINTFQDYKQLTEYLAELRINYRSKEKMLDKYAINWHKDLKGRQERVKAITDIRAGGIKVETIHLKDDLTGRVRVISRAFGPDKEPIPLDGGIVIIDPQEPLAPHQAAKAWVWLPLNLNAGLAAAGAKGALESRLMADVTLVGYGRSKQNLDYKFAGIGGNYNELSGLGLNITPASFRPMPNTLTNTYLGAGWYINSIENNYFINLSVGF